MNGFTVDQVNILKQSATDLREVLMSSNDLSAASFLEGELGLIIDSVLNNKIKNSIKEVPHFELMTRDILPEATTEYFNFYSLAKFGVSAY
jgi:hypothetical protein